MLLSHLWLLNLVLLLFVDSGDQKYMYTDMALVSGCISSIRMVFVKLHIYGRGLPYR
jgi:hypothetical protein